MLPHQNKSPEPGLATKKYLLGEFVLEPARRKLRLGDELVHLTRKPFQVLIHLVENRDRLVTRRELLEGFWEGHDVYDDTLTKCVGAIRKALDDPFENPRFIETFWAEGYRFIGPIEEESVDSSGSSSPGIRSIAVLPLKNLSNDSDNECFSDGMTDSLITALSKLEGLRVTSVSSVLRFKGHEVDPGEAGRILKVTRVLEGSVRKDGESVRVAVRLVSTEDHRVLWTSEVYNRSLDDTFALQDEIARSVTAGLIVQLGQSNGQL